MKLISTFVLALLLVPVCAGAAETNTAAPARISAADADKYYNQEMIVTGKVVQVTLRPTIVFINLDKPFPNSPFAAVIRSEDTNRFSSLAALEGKSVEIQGKIKEYRNKPEIILESADQLKVLRAAEATNAAAPK